MSAAKIIASSVRAGGGAVPPLPSGAPYHVLVMGKESQVSGWEVYCCDLLLLPITSYYFLLLPVAPGVSYCLPLVSRRSKYTYQQTSTVSCRLPLSPAVSRRLPTYTTRLKFAPQPPSLV